MAVVTVNALYFNGAPVGSCKVALNSEGRLPVIAIQKWFNAQYGLILDRPDGELLVADCNEYSTSTFTQPDTVTIFLLPPPKLAEEWSLMEGFMQLLQFVQSEDHAHACTCIV